MKLAGLDKDTISFSNGQNSSKTSTIKSFRRDEEKSKFNMTQSAFSRFTDTSEIIDQFSPMYVAEGGKRFTKSELDDLKYKEKTEKEKLKKELEEKKFKNTKRRLSPDENIICLAIDGSQNSKDTYEIIITEFLNRLKNSVLICPHIYDAVRDAKYNWRYQKDFVIQHFQTRLITTLAEYEGHLIMQERNEFKNHLIEQVYDIATLNNCLYFFCGYNGLREQSLKSENIDTGLDYLLKDSKMPVFIFKENYRRNTKNKGYKWLFIMDRTSSDCFRILDFIFPFFDLKQDFIHALAMIPQYVNADDIKKSFYERMQELDLKEDVSFTYQEQVYTESPSSFVIDFVNHNPQQYFDFVLFHNNPDKYKYQQQKSNSLKYIKSINANIVFSNILYNSDYSFKRIGKLPTEQDERTYLKKLGLDKFSVKNGEKKDDEMSMRLSKQLIQKIIDNGLTKNENDPNYMDENNNYYYENFDNYKEDKENKPTNQGEFIDIKKNDINNETKKEIPSESANLNNIKNNINNNINDNVNVENKINNLEKKDEVNNEEITDTNTKDIPIGNKPKPKADKKVGQKIPGGPVNRPKTQAGKRTTFGSSKNMQKFNIPENNDGAKPGENKKKVIRPKSKKLTSKDIKPKK